jgi:hypothetical protein
LEALTATSPDATITRRASYHDKLYLRFGS